MWHDTTLARREKLNLHLCTKMFSRVLMVGRKFRYSSKYFSSAEPRAFKYFDNLEVKDGIAIVRLNGPGLCFLLLLKNFKNTKKELIFSFPVIFMYPLFCLFICLLNCLFAFFIFVLCWKTK